MTQKEFVTAFKKFAVETEGKTGIDARFILAQAALESGWGKAAPGNMFFGVKDTDGVNGNEQLLTTTEYSRSATLKFPVIISVTPVVRNGVKMFKYRVKDYFRKYDSPEQSFTDHAQFFFKNKRYASALKVKDNPYSFADAIAKAGYATDPNYSQVLRGVIKVIDKHF